MADDDASKDMMVEKEAPQTPRERLYNVIFETDTRAGRVFDLVIIALIAVSIVSIILESYTYVHERYEWYFTNSEVIIVGIFTVEYLLRLWLCDLHLSTDMGVRTLVIVLKEKISYMLRPMPLIDLLAIAPFYISTGVIDLRFLRVLRVFRIFRVFKLARYSLALESLGMVFAKRYRVFQLLGFLVFVVLLSSASFLYSVEEKAGTFANIPDAFLWSIYTVAQVGSSAQPVTSAGQVIAGFMVIFLRIGIVCVFGGVFGAIFIEQMVHKRAQRCTNQKCGYDRIDITADYCPVCGHQIAVKPNCCEDNPHWAKFCRFCGKRLKRKKE
ncbi:MAG: ion transporter [Methanopyri archaeon]|nr:ion transporter [Methanopyri archaeon]